jgi:alpha-amylase/alpha-mannosidase (GH57 family)
MEKYICIHCHFYQPPRENPWLEEVEIQDLASPFHDWNERITFECYAPNSASRILDSERRIIDIVNNYTKISFDVGPTLLYWMERHHPSVYEAILSADKESRERNSGHGPGIAQPYNHMIMPLANSRDKRTQVVWGMRDFEHRFNRKPEGMWLPETAVDLETLKIMADEGIRFIILAPHQALKMRKIGEKEWVDVNGGKIDPRRPYACSLGNGKTIAIFFYDGSISHDIAFGDLLKNGQLFAKRLLNVFGKDSPEPEIVHIATDGETYGHHNRFGDMALAYCLYEIGSKSQAQITVYGEFLEKHPPTHEVQIVENSSWSCAHGVERWRSNCGCHSGRHPGWTQEWRSPLRKAMDWLRDKLASHFEKEVSKQVKNPWPAREDYIRVILDRSDESVQSFFRDHAASKLSKEGKVRLLRLLEMQRCAMLMYTSCGWFFDDISGIETVQVIQYAARAMQLAQETGAADFEPDFLKILKKAPSNIPEYGNGARVYELSVKPAVIDLLRVGVHYAVSSLFEDYTEDVDIGCFTARKRAYEQWEVGRQRLGVGRARLRSNIVRDEKEISYAVLHFGDHNLIGGVREYKGEEGFYFMKQDVSEAFNKSDIPGVINLMDKHFGTHNYSLWHLFRDEKRNVINQILESTLKGLESAFRQIYENQYPIMQAMKEMKIPLPKALASSADFILTTDLTRALKEEELDLKNIRKLVDEFKKWSFSPDGEDLGFVATQRIDSLMEKLRQKPQDLPLLESIESVLRILRELPLDLDLWKSQNVFFSVTRTFYQDMKKKSDRGEAAAKKWIENIEKVGRYLQVKIS